MVAVPCAQYNPPGAKGLDNRSALCENHRRGVIVGKGCVKEEAIMSDEPDDRDGSGEEQAPHLGLDADAVCARCGTVNPEGTLMCKACGNNLREQRTTRLAAGHEAMAAALGPRRTGWLAKALALLGLLVVLWTAMNVSRIEDFLVSAHMSGDAAARLMWDDEAGRAYAELAAELEANPVTPQERERALANPVARQGYAGRYVLMAEGGFRGRREVGQAIVRQVGPRILFVAELSRGMEVRGEAWLEDSGEPVARQTAAVRYKKRCHLASGFAELRDDGVFECLGLSAMDDERHMATAHRVPEQHRPGP